MRTPASRVHGGTPVEVIGGRHAAKHPRPGPAASTTRPARRHRTRQVGCPGAARRWCPRAGGRRGELIVLLSPWCCSAWAYTVASSEVTPAATGLRVTVAGSHHIDWRRRDCPQCRGGHGRCWAPQPDDRMAVGWSVPARRAMSAQVGRLLAPVVRGVDPSSRRRVRCCEVPSTRCLFLTPRGGPSVEHVTPADDHLLPR